MQDSDPADPVSPDCPNDPPPAWTVPLLDAFSRHLEEDLETPFRDWLLGLPGRFEAWLDPDLLEFLSPPADVHEPGFLDAHALVTVGSDNDEARLCIEGGGSGIAVARATVGPRIDRYLLSEDDESMLQESRSFLRRLDGWRGRGLLFGLSIAGRFFVGSTWGLRANVPREVESCVRELHSAVGELRSLIDRAVRTHRRFLDRNGGRKAKSQFAGVERVVRRYLPEVSIRDPYQLPGTTNEFGALVVVRFPGVGRSRLEFPLILEWSTENGRIVNAHLAIKGLGRERSLRNTVRGIEPCELCQGIGVGSGRQLPSGGYAFWMRPWYRLATVETVLEPNLFSALSPPRALCRWCQGCGLVRRVDGIRQRADEDLIYSPESKLESALVIIEESRRLRRGPLATLMVFVLIASGFAVGLEWLRRAIGDMPQEIHIAFWLVMVPLAYFVLGTIYHLLRYRKLQWVSPGIEVRPETSPDETPSDETSSDAAS